MTKSYLRFREHLKTRPLLYLKRGDEYVGVYCAQCAPSPKERAATGTRATKLTARAVWNGNWKCKQCRYPEMIGW